MSKYLQPKTSLFLLLLLTFSKVTAKSIAYIAIPQSRLDKDLTVIAVLLDGPIDLYREKVGAIENNL